jgi:hypothetical protein
MFEGDFNPTTVAIIVWGSLFGGVGTILLACYHQQRKGGYLKK